MKCKTCGHEIPELSKTIKIKELGIEVEIEVHNKGKKLSEIIIPKGWRMLKVEEVIWLANSRYANKLKMFFDGNDFVIEQPFKRNKDNGFISRFDAYPDGANLGCFGNPRNSSSSLGVRFCKSIKQENKK